MLKIGLVGNLSALAYREAIPFLDAEWEFGSPSRIAGGLKCGAFDAALLSTVCMGEVASVFEPAGPYGIACQGAVRSVRFVGKSPLDELIVRRAPVFLTNDSLTSRELFLALCAKVFGLLPELTPNRAEAQGFLLIGDEALAPTPGVRTWPEEIDLGQWWYEETWLPFVFAQWVVRRDLDAHSKNRVIGWLEQAASDAKSAGGAGRLIDRMMSLGFDRKFAEDYTRGIRQRLDAMDYRGLDHFRRLCQEVLPCLAIA